jgi:signal-transduction protein with cAMP-binding, CBS, and nucleotidyltransferase domain
LLAIAGALLRGRDLALPVVPPGNKLPEIRYDQGGLRMNRTAADIVAEKGTGIISISADATLREALQCMKDHGVGAILAERPESVEGAEEELPYVGIWTERDLMQQVTGDGFDIDTGKLSAYALTDLSTANADEQVYQLYDKFLGRRVRHLLIERDGVCIGLLSMGDVIRASLEQRVEEYRALNEMVSLEYYENWKAKQAERF